MPASADARWTTLWYSRSMEMNVRLAAFVVAASLGVATSSSAAHADAAGDKVLASVDAALNKATTLRLDIDSVNAEPGKPERTISFQQWTKADKYYAEYGSPADMKGLKLLVLSAADAYAYLPSFLKVRRIVTGTAADLAFFGMMFGVDDFWRTRYAPTYDATIASDSPKEWKLTLTAKAGQKPRSPKIEMIVAKDHAVPTELKFFDDKGALTKTETRTGYSCEGDVCTPGERKSIDAKNAAHWTKLVTKSRKVNAEIADKIFTKANLGD